MPSPPTEPLIVACDVNYLDTRATSAGVWFQGWSAADATFEATVPVTDVEAYQPGEFFRRELPCLLQILKRGPHPDIIVVDGYVYLDEGRPGLGDHLYRAIEARAAVVGVAKTPFAGATGAMPILRGQSRSPLYVSAVGVDLEEAAKSIASMHGPHRIPTLLKRADQLARSRA